MRPIVVEMSGLVDSLTAVSLSQSAGGAGDLLINGDEAINGVVVFSTAQILTITSSGSDSGIDFVVVGTDADGNPYTEVVKGEDAGAAVTIGHFLTVSQVSVTGATAGTVTIGAAAATGAVSKSIRVNSEQPNARLGLFVVISESPAIANLNYTVEHTADWPEDPRFREGSYSSLARWYPTLGLEDIGTGSPTNPIASAEGNIVLPVACVRLKLNNYVSGTCELTVRQSF